MSDEFYLQDSRSYVGNDMMFWASHGGYTTDVSKAEVFTKDVAQAQHDSRNTDIPWPKAYIDAKVRPAVDVQHVRREEALAGTGITIKKPKPYKKEVLQCVGCGRFVKPIHFYGGCPNCGKSY